MPAHNKSKVPVGTVLEGKYRVTKEIGRGGMAAVYEAVNIDIGKRVAVKILAAELITSKVVRERFLREARAAAGTEPGDDPAGPGGDGTAGDGLHPPEMVRRGGEVGGRAAGQL